MPNMINDRYGHKSIAVKNKLFVIGGFLKKDCEVFDSTTNKFTLLKQPTSAFGYNCKDPSGVITIGSKLFVFRNNSNVIIYDYNNDEWSEKICEAIKKLSLFSCASIPVKICWEI